jgi:hypothetical protein
MVMESHPPRSAEYQAKLNVPSAIGAVKRGWESAALRRKEGMVVLDRDFDHQ